MWKEKENAVCMTHSDPCVRIITSPVVFRMWWNESQVYVFSWNSYRGSTAVATERITVVRLVTWSAAGMVQSTSIPTKTSDFCDLWWWKYGEGRYRAGAARSLCPLRLYIVDVANTSHVHVLYCIAAFREAVPPWMKSRRARVSEDTCLLRTRVYVCFMGCVSVFIKSEELASLAGTSGRLMVRNALLFNSLDLT
jgi:hypothetical protein